MNTLFTWSQNFCKFSAFSLEFQIFSQLLQQFFLTVGQNNFGNKIPFLFVHKFQKSLFRLHVYSELFETLEYLPIYKVTSKLFSNHHIFCLSKSYFLRCIKIMNLWLYLVMSFWVILKRDALCLQLCSVSNFSTRHVQDFTNKGYIVAICPPLNCIPQRLKSQNIVLSWKLPFSIFFWTI